jgi:hypothetical protein
MNAMFRGAGSDFSKEVEEKPKAYWSCKKRSDGEAEATDALII